MILIRTTYSHNNKKHKEDLKTISIKWNLILKKMTTYKINIEQKQKCVGFQ